MIWKLSGLSKGKKIALKVIMMIAGLVITLFTSFWGMFIFAFAGQNFFAVLVPVTIIIFFILFCLLLFMSQKRKTILKIFFAVALLAAVLSCGKIAYQAYDDSVPIVSVMDFDLHNYMPLTGAKRALLDKPASVRITENFPVFDGAVATFPVYAAFAEALNPDLTEEEVIVYNEYDRGYIEPGTTVMCSNTPYAYRNLMYDSADMIFVAAPSERQIEEAKEAGKEFSMTPIAKEAFVFFVNKNNPVDNLTLQQVRDIYSGEIKNWKDVGGKRERIKAFQRPQNSGSQTALEKVMTGITIMPAPKRDRPGGMGGIVSRVAEYKNYGSAIGFSFRFFVSGMMENKDVKILKIDGIYPSTENIENGTYPLTSYFYAVTAGSKNPNIEKVIDWMLSEEGQEIIKKAGYTPIK